MKCFKAFSALSTVLGLLESAKTLLWLANVAKNIFLIYRAGGMMGLLMAALTNPITLTVLAVIALATAAFLLYTHWNQVSRWFVNMWAEWGGVIRLFMPVVGLVVDAASVIIKNWEPLKTWFANFWQGIVDKGSWAANQIKRLAGSLPNTNFFTGQRYTVPASGDATTSMVPGGRPLLTPNRPTVAAANRQDHLSIALKIDSEGRPSLTKVDKGGNRNLNFMADMGMIYAS